MQELDAAINHVIDAATTWCCLLQSRLQSLLQLRVHALRQPVAVDAAIKTAIFKSCMHAPCFVSYLTQSSVLRNTMNSHTEHVAIDLAVQPAIDGAAKAAIVRSPMSQHSNLQSRLKSLLQRRIPSMRQSNVIDAAVKTAIVRP